VDIHRQWLLDTWKVNPLLRHAQSAIVRSFLNGLHCNFTGFLNSLAVVRDEARIFFRSFSLAMNMPPRYAEWLMHVSIMSCNRPAQWHFDWEAPKLSGERFEITQLDSWDNDQLWPRP